MTGKRLLVLCMVSVFSLCASFALAAPLEIKVAHSSPAANDKLEDSLQEMIKYVNDKIGDKVKLVSYPASQLGSEREELEGVQMGTIEMAVLSTGPFPSVFPEIMLIDLPYVIPNEKVAYALLDGAVGNDLNEKMIKKAGLRVLAWGENGFRCFTGKKELAKPADFKGLKVRLMENPMHQSMVKELGGIPATIPFGELYTALSQGVVDAQENPISLIQSMRFYEVQNNITLDNHVYNPHILFTNNDFFTTKLTPEQQKVIQEGADIFKKVERQRNALQSEEGLKYMESQGMKVRRLSAEEHEALREATKATLDILRKRIGAKTVDEYLNTVSKIKAETGTK